MTVPVPQKHSWRPERLAMFNPSSTKEQHCRGTTAKSCHTQRVQPPPLALQRVGLPSDYKQRVYEQFESRAPRYDTGNRYHPPLAAKLLNMAMLKTNERVLDVGCGTGYVAIPAVQAVCPTGSVTGVDLSHAMIEQGKRKADDSGLTSITWIVADIDQCEFDPGSFDVILCSSALPFLPDIPTSLCTWRMWLRDGGRVCFNAPKGVGSQAFSVFARAAARRGLLLDDPSTQFESERHVRKLLEDAGFAGSIRFETTSELNVRKGQSAKQWAAAGWELCVGMPFADLPSLLSAEELEEMKRDYLDEAAQLAQQFVSSDGIAEPYQMLWVLAS